MNILLRTMMMGGIDGIITIFNIISSIEGSKLNYKYIFILGLAALVSDAIGMGFGEYVSVKAEQKYNKSKEFNEGDPCFPDGVYNGIDNQGNTMCTCGSKGQYCNDIFDAQGGLVTDGVYIVNVGDYFNVGSLASY